MNATELNDWCTTLRTEIDTAVEEQRQAAERAVLAMRRLALVEALAATYPPIEVATVSVAEQMEAVMVTELASPAKATPSKPKAKSTRSPGRQSTVDYEAVAEVILEARAAGKPVTAALADHFNAPTSTVKNWVLRCKALGLLDAKPARQPRAAAPAPVREAPPEPKPPANTTPIDWDGPKPMRPHDPSPPVEKVYRCECGEQLATENELAKHTMSRHGRPPRALEQTRVSAA